MLKVFCVLKIDSCYTTASVSPQINIPLTVKLFRTSFPTFNAPKLSTHYLRFAVFCKANKLFRVALFWMCIFQFLDLGLVVAVVRFVSSRPTAQCHQFAQQQRRDLWMFLKFFLMSDNLWIKYFFMYFYSALFIYIFFVLLYCWTIAEF